MQLSYYESVTMGVNVKLWLIKNWHIDLERYIRGGEGVQARLSFFSIMYGTIANISRKPLTGGMASQHLLTFERMDIFKSADLNVIFIWIF